MFDAPLTTQINQLIHYDHTSLLVGVTQVMSRHFNVFDGYRNWVSDIMTTSSFIVY